MPADTFDAIVVGGSFAGLSAAMQLARARRRVLLVDAGRPRNRFAPASHGFFGQDGRSPSDIMETGRAQVLAYPTVSFAHDEATQAVARDGVFEIALRSGDAATARRLVLATGVADELADIPGLRERWGRTVLHCPYCHGYEFADRRLGILAVGEANLHQAMLLPDWSADVVLFTNGIVEPSDEQLDTFARRGIRVETRPVASLEGEGTSLAGVRFGDGSTVPIDALFTASRIRMASPLAEQLGCALDEGPFGPMIRTNEHKETTVEGVFAAGDATRSWHNATLASADGVMAGTAAHRSMVFAG